MFDCFDQTASNGAKGPLTLIYRPLQAESDEETVEYDMEEIHFHFDKSEHEVEGTSYPAEAHLKFKSSEGDLVAVGILLIDDYSDTDMDFPTFGLQRKMKKVKTFNKSFEKTIKIKPLKRLLKKALGNVYLYTGSLTTPPCTLGLPWIVSAKPAYVKPKFLRKLQKLEDESGNVIGSNYRPLQAATELLDICLLETA